MSLFIKSMMTLSLNICSMTVIALDTAGPEVTMPGTETRLLTSKLVRQEYRLLISLPAGYRESDQHYPVLYILDAQWDFPLFYSIYGQQYYDGFIPGLLIVGVTWGGADPNPDLLRRRDFTPSDVSGNGDSGGSARFLTFFEKELIPYIDQQYRTSENRTLAGSSLGGLFTLYALFNRPDLFNNFIATSPATPWDNEALYRSAEGFSKRSAQNPSRLFIAVAEKEDLIQPVMQLVGILKQRKYPGLTWTSHVVEGAGHSGVKPEGNTRGLQYAFERPDLVLTEEQLMQIPGTYQSEDGSTEVQLSIQDGKLKGHTPADGQSWIFNAQDKTHFYHDGSFLKVNLFSDENGQTSGFVVQTYGGTQEFRKLHD